ncbi:MAG: hypothetical protein QOF61_399 [Acidobacteriota bacterium]|jgi:hypothetical protein|nr:hypothetical protein [Acidobacteriota bacterium]
MAHEPHKQTAHTTTPAPQQRILRALVGSLVFCATLGTANVPVRACGQYANVALARASVLSKAQAHASRAACARGANVVSARADRLDSVSVPRLNHMIASASGKQLSREPGMSREQAGNLIRQNLSLP